MIDTMTNLSEDMMFMTEDQISDLASQQEQSTVETRKFLIFLTDDLRMGVDAEYVVEIITNHPITKLRLVPTYVRGIINLRGQIIPIVDTRILLRCDGEDNQCIIILNIEGTLVGILIDSVMKMVDVDKESLRQDLAQKAQNLVSGMCSLPDGQTMLVFDCAQILNQV